MHSARLSTTFQACVPCARMPHSNDPTTTRAAPALVPPTTPQHPKSGAALDQLLRKLEDEWQLDLEVGGQQTPAKMRTTAGKAKQKIQYLFYSSMPVLHGVLRRFKEDVPRRRNISRLELLDSLLREEVSAQSPRSGTATPVSTRNQPPKSLLCKCSSASLLQPLSHEPS